MNLFEKIDVDYLSSLHDAYGHGRDFLELLKDVFSGSKEVRSHAYDELFGRICHQSSVYDSTAYLFPFLVNAYFESDFPNEDIKKEFFYFVAAIAGGMPSCFWLEFPKDRREKEREIEQAIRHEGKRVVPELISSLAGKETFLRDIAAEVLPAYPGFYGQSLPALEKALAIENDEDVREMMEEAIDKIKESKP